MTEKHFFNSRFAFEIKVSDVIFESIFNQSDIRFPAYAVLSQTLESILQKLRRTLSLHAPNLSLRLSSIENFKLRNAFRVIILNNVLK